MRRATAHSTSSYGLPRKNRLLKMIEPALVAGHALRHGFEPQRVQQFTNSLGISAHPGERHHGHDSYEGRDSALEDIQIRMPEAEPAAIDEFDVHPIDQQRCGAQLAY